MTQRFNPSAWETEAGGSLRCGQPDLHGEFQTIHSYTMRLCLKNKNTNQKKTNLINSMTLCVFRTHTRVCMCLWMYELHACMCRIREGFG